MCSDKKLNRKSLTANDTLAIRLTLEHLATKLGLLSSFFDFVRSIRRYNDL